MKAIVISIKFFPFGLRLGDQDMWRVVNSPWGESLPPRVFDVFTRVFHVSSETMEGMTTSADHCDKSSSQENKGKTLI